MALEALTPRPLSRIEQPKPPPPPPPQRTASIDARAPVSDAVTRRVSPEGVSEARRSIDAPASLRAPVDGARGPAGTLPARDLVNPGANPGSTETRPRPTGRAGRTPAALEAKHQQPANDARTRLSPTQQRDMTRFQQNYQANRSRYEEVARRTNMPPEMVAAIHWRESNGNFDTYLHQGDPLGRRAVNHPRNIPVFHNWEDGATHALHQKRATQEALGINRTTTDPARLAAYAETYNGLGYHGRGVPSPYVYAGTDQYQRGKFTSDGRYDARHVDQQLGIIPMLRAITPQPRTTALA